MFKTIFDAWSSFAFSPCDQSYTPSTAQSESTGAFIAGQYQGGGRVLRYRLFVPDGVRSRPQPLVVMLHGCGQDALDFARGTDMNVLAGQHGCLVLYPEQPASAHWNRCWNWYDEAHHRRGEGEPALIAGLTRRIMAEYKVDAMRVAVAGLSSGGAMAVILGRTYPDLFRAVGCHSGLAHGSATSGTRAMQAMRDGPDLAALTRAGPCAGAPVIVFHGDADGTVHRENGCGVVRQRVFHAGGGILEQTGSIGGRTYTRRVHRNLEGSVLAEHWIVHGTGHAWSGGNPRGSYTEPCGPSASEEMLRFFIRDASS